MSVGAGEQRWEPGNEGGSWGMSVGAEEHQWELVHIDSMGAGAQRWGLGCVSGGQRMSVVVVRAWACAEMTEGVSITQKVYMTTMSERNSQMLSTTHLSCSCTSTPG